MVFTNQQWKTFLMSYTEVEMHRQGSETKLCVLVQALQRTYKMFTIIFYLFIKIKIICVNNLHRYVF